MAKAIIGAAPKSNNVYIDALTWGGNRWSQKNGPITYTFNQSEEGMAPWTAADKSAFKLAFSLFSNVANISFSAAPNPQNTNFNLILTKDPIPGAEQLLALMVPPGANFGGGLSAGTGIFSLSNHPNWYGQLKQGGFSFSTVIHEVGHGLGLAHPHDKAGGSSLFPGIDGYNAEGVPILQPDGTVGFEGDTGDNDLNIGLNTMMSYNNAGQAYAPAKPSNFGFEATPMALDIAALQHLYGANMSYRTGNDTYKLLQANKVGTFWSCIWDAGGIDTISNEGSNRAATINLQAAPLTGPKAGGHVSAIKDNAVHGGFTIANRVTIENAVGGKAGDRIIGNGAANRIDGGGGTDAMIGKGGNDTYLVDDRKDVVAEVRGQGDDTVVSIVSYSLFVGSSVETLRLAAARSKAALTLDGSDTVNTLIGNAGNNRLDGKGGADTLIGLAGNDTYRVDHAKDRVVEAKGQGRDTVISTVSYVLAKGQEIETLQLAKSTDKAALNLTGNEFGNTLIGNDGGNRLNGREGADKLHGQGGNDLYIVDTHSDKVFEAKGRGNDTVISTVSYELAKGQEIETLRLAASTGKQALNQTGNAFDNVLRGNDGKNILDGGDGADKLYGRSGDDLYLVDDAGDQIVEKAGQGNDTVWTDVSYELLAGQEIETLAATGKTAQNLNGNAFGQDIVGNSASNRIDGGLGKDLLSGGYGEDTFVFSTKLGGGNVDTLVDFGAPDPGGFRDTIQLSEIVFSALAPGQLAQNAFKVIDDAQVDGDDRILYRQATGELFYDADGSGDASAQLFAVNAYKGALKAGDFLVA